MAGLTKNSLGIAGHNLRHNVRRLRIARRLTYVELSEHLSGVGRPIPVLGLSRIENGERRVDADDLVALADVFGVTPALLLEPPTECTTCHGTPPPGFACTECGAESGKQLRAASAGQPGSEEAAPPCQSPKCDLGLSSCVCGEPFGDGAQP